MKVELENFSFHYVNTHWLMTEMPLASFREPGGQLIPKKLKSEDLVIVKCIDSVYFTVGFVNPL